MSDRVNALFRQRFQDHETPIDMGLWEGIQQQLTATPAVDGVNKLLRERFQGHEVPVEPAVWAHVSQRLGQPAVAATTSAATWGWVAAGAVAVVLATATWLGEPTVSDPATPEQVTERTTVLPEPTADGTDVAQAPLASAVAEPARTNSTIQAIGRGRAGTSDTATAQEPPLTAAPDPDRVQGPTASDAAPHHTEAHEQGTLVVSGIISDLEEEVKHKPVTATPEPVLSRNPEARTLDQDPDPIVVGTSATDAIAPPALPKLFMPNTFTPNGDGVNDTYTVDGDAYAAILLRVYSMKSNALVFATNSGEPWTGAGCEDGMYMVAVEAHTLDGLTTTEGKVVWLSRNRMN